MTDRIIKHNLKFYPDQLDFLKENNFKIKVNDKYIDCKSINLKNLNEYVCQADFILADKNAIIYICREKDITKINISFKLDEDNRIGIDRAISNYDVSFIFTFISFINTMCKDLIVSSQFCK